MQVHVLMELTPDSQLPTAVVPTVTYGELHWGSSRVLSAQLECPYHGIPTKAVVGQVAPANQVPLVVLPVRPSKESNAEHQKGWFLEALDLQDLKE